MKKILMSIFLVLMLAFGMLVNVDIAKAQEIRVDTSINPESPIIGIDDEIRLTLTIENLGLEIVEIQDIEMTVATKDAGNDFELGFGIYQERIQPGHSIEVRYNNIEISEELEGGIYTGDITITYNSPAGEEEPEEIFYGEYSITLIDNEAPVVAISGGSNSITAIVGEEVEFEGTATDATGEPSRYEWKIFDNDETPIGQTYRELEDFSHVFDAIGNYKVTFQAWDNGNFPSNIAEKTINIEAERMELKLYEGDNIVEYTDKITLSGAEDTTQETTYNLRNTGNVDLEGITIKFTGDFTDEDSNKVKLYLNNNEIALEQIYRLNNINKNSNQNIVFKAVIPEDMEINNYDGIITIIGESTFSEETVTYLNENFEVIIEPKTCKDGVIGDIRVKNLDVDEDDLTLGEDQYIEVDLEVENKNNDDDYDVIVKAMVYNLDKNEDIIPWTEVESLNVEEDSEEDVSFELELAYHEDIDEGDKYVLYVKAYEDGNEDEHCNYGSIELDINREDDDIIIYGYTITPTTASIGDLVSFSIEVENVGIENQDDVYIQILNTELGLDIESIKFDLDKYSKRDNDMIKTLTFVVPEGAVAKEHNIEARVYFRSGREYNTAFGKLTVEGEGTIPNEPETPGEEEPETQPETGAGTYTVTGGSIFDNIGSTKTLFIIGDIVLVILAVLFLILIFRRK